MDKYASATETRRNPSFSYWKLVGIKDAAHPDKKHSRHKKAPQDVSAVIYTPKIAPPFITNTDGPEDLQVSVTRPGQPSKDRRVRGTAPELPGMLRGGHRVQQILAHQTCPNARVKLTAPCYGFVL